MSTEPVYSSDCVESIRQARREAQDEAIRWAMRLGSATGLARLADDALRKRGPDGIKEAWSLLRAIAEIDRRRESDG